MHAVCANIKHNIPFKDACSKIFWKWIFFKLIDMVTFPTKTLQICISFVSNLGKQCLCYLLFYKWWKPHFLISKRVFNWFFLNYTDFAHKISHIKPSKDDSTFGTKISICLKKVGGMRLWIGTSTFKLASTDPFLLKGNTGGTLQSVRNSTIYASYPYKIHHVKRRLLIEVCMSLVFFQDELNKFHHHLTFWI